MPVMVGITGVVQCIVNVFFFVWFVNNIFPGLIGKVQAIVNEYVIHVGVYVCKNASYIMH